MQWDVFCQVVDNYGDAGVCWRLARELTARGQQVRLWIDDVRPLKWMAGLADAVLPTWHEGIALLPWKPDAEDAGGVPDANAIATDLLPTQAPDVLIEAFGCAIPQVYLQALEACCANAQSWPLWLNLEYLCAEDYVERMHALPSPVMHGAGRGQSKTFFYPGFTPATGGLLREQDLIGRQQAWDRQALRRALCPVAAEDGDEDAGAFWVSLFAYEPACLPDWLRDWSQRAQGPVHLLACAGRSQTWLAQCWEKLGWKKCSGKGPESQHWRHGQLHVHTLDFLPQDAYDQLLWACDLNIVRGEDSLVRALWAQRPMLWHIYAQSDDAHHAKLEAFLDWLHASVDLRRSMYALNGIGAAHAAAPDLALVQQWQAAMCTAREHLLAQDDLVTQLIAFAQRQR